MNKETKEILQLKLLIEELEETKEKQKQKIKYFKEELKKYPKFCGWFIGLETAVLLTFFQNDNLLNMTYRFSPDLNINLFIVSSLSVFSGIIAHKISKANLNWKLKSEESLYHSVCYNLTNKQKELEKKDIKENIATISEELEDDEYIEKIKKTKRELTIYQDYLMNYKDFYKWQKHNTLNNKLDNGFYDEESIKYIEKIMARDRVRQRKSEE